MGSNIQPTTEAAWLGIPASDLAPLMQTMALLIVSALIILLVIRPLIERAIESEYEEESQDETKKSRMDRELIKNH